MCSKVSFPRAVVFAVMIFLWASSHISAANPLESKADEKVDAKTVSEVDAGLGPCTADFIITDEAGAPVYAANVRVHIAYGFMSLHKFDLQVGTNAEGKARFIGLPENSKQGLFFLATDADREGTAFDNPSKTCKARFTVVLRKKSEQ
jgi:hypothetical protein